MKGKKIGSQSQEDPLSAIVGPMPISENDLDVWERLARDGRRDALASLFAAHEGKLRRWVEHRIDPRLRGRLSPSDVLQEVYLAADQRLEHFRGLAGMPFWVWIRLLSEQRLIDVHRRHLGAQARDAGQEVSLDRDNSTDLAARLAGDFTSPSGAAVRRETLDLLVVAIEAMDPLDREVLSLRHFEEMGNDEVARALGIPEGTASKRYVRALARLRAVLEKVPGLLE